MPWVLLQLLLAASAASEDKWLSMSDTHCDTISSGLTWKTYFSLSSAQDACSRNPKCSGIYDRGCDYRAPFYLCSSSSSLEFKRKICVYAKQEAQPQKPCDWSIQVGKYSSGYAGRVSTQFSSVADAQSKCVELGEAVCKAVTCSSRGTCTVRASASFRTSPSGDITYAPSTECFTKAPVVLTPQPWKPVPPQTTEVFTTPQPSKPVLSQTPKVLQATCSSTGKEVLNRLGKSRGDTVTVDCPGGCASGNYPVYGSGAYSERSSVCAAGIHAGMFQSIGGSVTVIFEPKAVPEYCATESHGIQSSVSSTLDSEQFRFKNGPRDLNQDADCEETLKELTEMIGGSLGAIACVCCFLLPWCCGGKNDGKKEKTHQKLLDAFGLRGRTAIPVYWENCGRNLELALDRSNPEFFDEMYPVNVEVKQSLQDLLNNTNQFRSDLPGFSVVRAVRVEDAVMWANYQTCTAEIEATQGDCAFAGQGSPITMEALESLHNNEAFAHNLDDNVCEAYLWHSTSPEAAMKIAEDGFQVGLSKSKRFGAGGYFAEDPGKADSYAKAGQGLYADCYAILLCRVVLGRQDYITSNSGSGRRSTSYDSLLAEPPGAPREFIVYKDAQVYPEYAIVYERCHPDSYEGDYWDDDTADTMRGSLPTYWHNNARVAFGAFDEMYPAQKMKDVVQKMFDDTWRDVYTRDRKGADGQRIPKGDPNGDMPLGLTVCKVLRVEDSQMWAKYINYQNEVRYWRGAECSSLDYADVKTTAALSWKEKRRLAGDVNEVYLWHGSNPRAVISIAEDGFDLDLSGSATGQMFGNGAYFSECASKADEYSHDEADGYYKGYYAMLLCRVTLGEVQTLTSADPHAHTRVGSGLPFDSTIGDRESAVNTYREFVSVRKDGIYPEYAIIYERRYAKARVRSLAAPRWRKKAEARPVYETEDEYYETEDECGME